MTWIYIVLRNTGSEPTGGLTIEYLIPSPMGIGNPAGYHMGIGQQVALMAYFYDDMSVDQSCYEKTTASEIVGGGNHMANIPSVWLISTFYNYSGSLNRCHTIIYVRDGLSPRIDIKGITKRFHGGIVSLIAVAL